MSKKLDAMTDAEILALQIEGCTKIIEAVQDMINTGVPKLQVADLRRTDPFMLVSTALSALEATTLRVFEEKRLQEQMGLPTSTEVAEPVTPVNKKLYN